MRELTSNEMMQVSGGPDHTPGQLEMEQLAQQSDPQHREYHCTLEGTVDGTEVWNCELAGNHHSPNNMGG